MKAIGLHARAPGGRYVVGIAVVENDGLVLGQVLSSPDADAARSLHELHGRIRDVIQLHAPDRIALWPKDANRGYSAALGAARNAEGVLLSAAGSEGHSVTLHTGASVRAALSLSGGKKNAEVIDAAMVGLSDAPADRDVAAAAAVARAALGVASR